jgi:hypothetical protein
MKEEQQPRKIMELLNEAKVIVSFMVMVVTFFVWINVQLVSIQKDIEVIQTNHLVHIQMGIDKNTEQIQANQDTIIGILLELKEHSVILNP